MIQCMGGFCRSRDSCAHYVAMPTPGMRPSERLCGDVEEPEQIRETAAQLDAQRRRFAADPRFAAWAAGAPK